MEEKDTITTSEMATTLNGTAARDREGDWILTYTGKQFWPLDPRPEEVCIEDIAHALSMLCRFTGHTRVFYSVAEHCVHVSRFVPAHYKLAGLLHDAAEAYLADMSAPVKQFIPSFTAAEFAVQTAIARHFRMGSLFAEVCKEEDRRMLHTERIQLMPLSEPWHWLDGFPPYDLTLPCWSPAQAEDMFMRHYEEIVSASTT